MDRAGGFGRIISDTGARYRTSVSCKYLRASVDLEVDDNFAVIMFRPVGCLLLGAGNPLELRRKRSFVENRVELAAGYPYRLLACQAVARPAPSGQGRKPRSGRTNSASPEGTAPVWLYGDKQGDTFGILIAPGYSDSPKPRFLPKLLVGSGYQRRSARQAIDPIGGGGLTLGLIHSCQSHSEMRARSRLQSTLVCLISYHRGDDIRSMLARSATARAAWH